MLGRHLERFGPIRQSELEGQKVPKDSPDPKYFDKLKQMKEFQEATRKIADEERKRKQVQDEKIRQAKLDQITTPRPPDRNKDGSAAARSSSKVKEKRRPLKPSDECRLDLTIPKKLDGSLQEVFDNSMKKILDGALADDDYICPRLCAFCHTDGFDMSVCSLCKVTAYCSPKCQKDNERNHKRECQNVLDNRIKEIQKNVVKTVSASHNNTNNNNKASANGKKKNGGGDRKR